MNHSVVLKVPLQKKKDMHNIFKNHFQLIYMEVATQTIETAKKLYCCSELKISTPEYRLVQLLGGA